MGQAFATGLNVRYAECDSQGVVFNAHYLAYFDVAITELWRAALGGYQTMLDRGIDLVVAEAQLRFERPATFDDELTLEIAITKLGNSSILSSHNIYRDGERLVVGSLRHVVVSRDTLEKAAIPDWMRAGLSPWLVDGT
jgi:acyl-CoA thioester hydrolase